jgi:hypothetical protein
MIQQNLNAYNEEQFFKEFTPTEIYQQLSQDYSKIYFDNTTPFVPVPTPRQRLAESFANLGFSAVSFYYLEYLTRHNPEVIYDLGCGANYFKRYIPNIIGIGEEPPDNMFFRGDISGKFDQQWVEENQGKIASIFSICALHFIPITQMRQQVLDLASTLTPGGRAYIALNASRMCERMRYAFLKHQRPFDQTADAATVDQYIREQLSDMPFTYEVFDVDITESGHRNLRHDYYEQFDNVIDGNIRMVIWNNKI